MFQIVCSRGSASRAVAEIGRCIGRIALGCGLLLPPAAAAAETRGLAYEIASGDSTLYLLGSVHFAKPSLYPLPPAIEIAFSNSTVLALEVDLREAETPAAQQSILKKGTYGPGENLRAAIPPKTLKALQEYLEQQQMVLEPFLSFRPGLLAITLTTMALVQLGYLPEHGLDQYFLRQADGRKTILGLESVEDQMALMLEMPNEELLLEYTLMELNSMASDIGKIMDAWVRGDEAALEQLMIADVLATHPDFKPLYDRLFFERNREMADHIKRFLRADEVHFVVVGCGHLVGREGILELLRGDGYAVRRLGEAAE
jgi:uncharacterized protein YbaP (TraB family)